MDGRMRRDLSSDHPRRGLRGAACMDSRCERRGENRSNGAYMPERSSSKGPPQTLKMAPGRGTAGMVGSTMIEHAGQLLVPYTHLAERKQTLIG